MDRLITSCVVREQQHHASVETASVRESMIGDNSSLNVRQLYCMEDVMLRRLLVGDDQHRAGLKNHLTDSDDTPRA